MEITAGQFTDKVTNDEVQRFEHEVKLTKSLSKAKLKDAAKQLVDEVQDAIDSGYLAESVVKITGLKIDVSFALQTGIINLPWQDTKKLVHFFDNEEKASVKSYFVTIGEWVNASHLRIDEVANDATQMSEATEEMIVTMMSDNLQQALENYETAQQQAKEEKNGDK